MRMKTDKHSDKTDKREKCSSAAPKGCFAAVSGTESTYGKPFLRKRRFTFYKRWCKRCGSLYVSNCPKTQFCMGCCKPRRRKKALSGAPSVT
jgi:hypothetical protein